MSIEISTRVWKQSHQKGTRKLFLLALADHANGDGYCYPGIERISEWCEVDERQARRISAELQEVGQIYVKVGGGRFGTNEYLIAAGMASDEIEAALVKYFKMTKKDAFDATQIMLEKQYNAANQNPVVQTPPVIQDQNPVTQGTNPVVQTPRTVINHQEPKQKEPPVVIVQSPQNTTKPNVYASYNRAFGEPIANPTSIRTLNAVEDLEDFPGDWLDEAFLRTSKRERAAEQRWKDYQRFPYALQLLNEWKRAKGIQPETQPRPAYKPTYQRSGASKPTVPAWQPPTEAEAAARVAQIQAQRAARQAGSP